VSVRALAVLALLLGLLLAGSAALAAHRFGWLGPPPPPPALRFENALLRAESRQGFLLQPQDVSRPVQRYLVDHVVTDPDSLADPKLLHGSPHVVLLMGTDDPADPASGFKARQVVAMLLDRMGALSESEWLRSMRVVRERRSDGFERPVVEAAFERREGGTSRYYFDPDAPVPPVGWMRLEVEKPVGPPEVYFARPAN
jgi:hypothetical protein